MLLAFYPGGEPDQFWWTEPVARVDGTPLVPSQDISAYILRCSKDGTPNALNQTIAVGGQTTWNVAQGTFGPGTWVCSLYARDQEALESDPTGPLEFLVTTYTFKVAPRSPTGLRIG
jgi:hypothetical protein